MSSSDLVHEYELVYIAQPELDEEGMNTLSDRFSQTVSNFGGTINSVEPWGRRTLAYPIKNFFEGHYILLRFTMEPQGADEVDRFLRLNENVIRYLLIRTDE
ncbi:MAG: 30S ribosomal protein S6 [Caldilineaceae bacterium]|nr:30S ribosomal protein S6 [Caldilineaceae bacterium]